jgi:1-acyl-sn-glycerol-3-phosphate acyltransferase
MRAGSLPLRYGSEVTRLIARLWLALWRFRAVEPATTIPARCVIIAAPHTTNWDFPMMLALAKVSGIKLTWLGKNELFRGPMGPIMRKLGGVPVVRDKAGTMVADLVAELAKQDTLRLLVPAEGTRSRSEYWKSGFYRIARAAEVPILFGFIDHATHTGGFGSAMLPTNDVRADMDKVRAFYADKAGLRPGNSGIPRLAEEDR